MKVNYWNWFAAMFFIFIAYLTAEIAFFSALVLFFGIIYMTHITNYDVDGMIEEV